MKSFLQISEEQNKKIAILFGRMNPPTKGHEENVEGLKTMANKQGADHLVIASHSQDAKKNPLSPDVKLKHLKRAFPNTNIITSSKEKPTILHHAADAHAKGYTHLTVVAGADRVDEYKRLLNHYNGKGADEAGRPLRHGNYNFKTINVVSSGERKEGISGTDMRNHATNNDYESFKKNLSSSMRNNDAHARELFKDVRRGMGMNENVNRGLFKAIFVSGGPGSGKDIVIREAISERKAVEINAPLALAILNDKHKLFEQTRDIRREAIRNRYPLIINGTTKDYSEIISVKEELEELGYETMMVFVNTTDESSRKRNENHTRVMEESIRKERWEKTQIIAQSFNENFTKYLEFDNSINLNEATFFEKQEKEEDLSLIFEMTNWFFDISVENDISNKWLMRNKKINMNSLFEQAFLKNNMGENYVSKNKTNSKSFDAKTESCTCGTSKASSRLFSGFPRKKGQRILDNICPSCQLTAKAGRIDDVRDGDIASNTKYTFRTYHEGSQPTSPTVTRAPEAKETKFQQDADKIKAKKQKTNNSEAGKVMKVSGISPEYDTRGSGTVYPMSGLGMVTYREQKEDKYTSAAEVKQKSFNKFRKEAIDSPGIDMGVTGTAHGPTNKEPLETLNKIETNPIIKKKKK
jgi:hypothetical protein